MTAALRNFGCGPHGAIAVKAWLDHRNYCETDLLDEAWITERIVRTMVKPGITQVQAREAIRRGFEAARENRQIDSISVLETAKHVVSP